MGVLCVWHTGLSARIIIVICLILFSDHICWYIGHFSCAHRPSTCLIQSLPLLFSLSETPRPLWTLGRFVAASSIKTSLPPEPSLPAWASTRLWNRMSASDCGSSGTCMFLFYAELLRVGSGSPMSLSSQPEPATCPVERPRGTNSTDWDTQESTAGLGSENGLVPCGSCVSGWAACEC